MAFMHAGGHVIERQLKNETLRVDTGCLVGFTPDVAYDIQRAGNLKSMLFGGEGVFVATLSGSGTVWLQSLPFSRLADRVIASAPRSGGSSKGEGSVLGGLIPSVGQTFVVVLAVAALHLLFSSNTVTGSIIIPILIALAQDLGLDVWTVAAPAAFTSSLAFILVTETPTNVVPYSAGYFSIRDMAKSGVWMTLAAALCLTLAVVVVGTIIPGPVPR